MLFQKLQQMQASGQTICWYFQTQEKTAHLPFTQQQYEQDQACIDERKGAALTLMNDAMNRNQGSAKIAKPVEVIEESAFADALLD